MFSMTGSFPCDMCGYVAGSHRMLARHRAATHESKVFRCSECPFVTRYRTNLYRHRREIHGLNKVNACALCGFFSTNIDDLSLHQQTCSMGGNNDFQSQSLYSNEYPPYEMFPNEYLQFGPVPSFKEPFPSLPQASSSNEYEPTTSKYNDYESTTSKYNDYESTTPKYDYESTSSKYNEYESTTSKYNDYEMFNQPPPYNNETYNYIPSNPPPPSNISFNEIETTPDMFVLPPTISQATPTSKAAVIPKSKITVSETSKSLEPAKVRRSYSCEPCDLKTTNPREFLAHRRDVHKEKIKIYECKYCIYASKNPQKLERHCGLVHRSLTKKLKKSQVAKKSWSQTQKRNKIMKEVVKRTIKLEKPGNNINEEVILEEPPNPVISKVEVPFTEVEKECIQRAIQQKFKCSACHFHTKSKFVLLHHEKTKHLKKKFYRCLQCVYVTHVKSRYTKHVRYHSLSKVKCPHCDFQTAYKWNLDRHMKNHITEGNFNCSKCCFSAHSKQSLTIHIVNHHSEIMNSLNNDDLATDDINAGEDKNLQMSLPELEQIEPNAREANVHDNNISRSNGNLRQKNKSNLDDSLENTYMNPSTTIENQTALKPKSQKAIKSGWSSPATMPKKQGTEREKKYSCPLCEVTFDHLAWLARHLNRRHSTNEQAKDISAIVQMLAAKKKQNALSKLKNRRSKKKAHRATPICAVCGYKTKWFSEMKRHMRVHTDEKPFECPFCDYKCRWKGDLTRHIQKRHDEMAEQSNEVYSQKFIGNNDEADSSGLAKHNKRSDKMTRKGLRKLEEEDAPLDLSVGGNITLPSSKYQNDISQYYQESQYYGNGNNEKNLQIEARRYSNSPSGSNREISFHMQNAPLLKSYKCVFCNFTTTNEFHFKVHNTRHFTKYPFMCSVCSFRSNWQWKIMKHIKKHHKVEQNRGTARVLLIDSKGDVSECCSDTGENMYDNTVNGEESNTSDGHHSAVLEGYTTKKRNSTNKKYKSAYVLKDTSNYICKYCEFKDKERRNVLAHMCDHTGQKPYHCRICGFRSLWLNVLKRHVRRRHKGRLCDIEECFKIIEKAHVVSIIGTAVLQISNSNQEKSKITTLCSCKICPYKCMGQNVLENHIKHHNPASNATYKCRFCPYYCRFKDTIVKHLNVHGMSISDATKIVSQCTIPQVNNHISSSHEKYKCSNCPYKTDSSTNYLFHKQGHRPNKNALFKCKQCSFWANHQLVLNDHIKLHSKQRKDYMKSRDRETNSKRKQFQSMPTEIEIKQNGKMIKVYRCRYCPMMGESLDTVYAHELLHDHNSKAVKCNICAQICESDEHLTTHLKVHIKNTTQAEYCSSEKYPIEEDKIYRKNQVLANSSFHRRENYQKYSYFCTKCPAAFSNKTEFSIHRQIHESNGSSSYNNDIYDFKIENESFTEEYMLKRRFKYNKDGIINEIGEHLDQNMSFQHGSKINNNSWNDQTGEQAAENTGFDQMLLLEEAETKSFIKGNSSNVIPQKLQNCCHCPAAFCKPAILAFHVSLHGAQGRYMCSECNYATDAKNNVITHYQLHVKTKSVSKTNLRIYECSKCPAKFQKPKGLQKHFALHGQNNKFTCEICDYSVPCAVNLFRHKVVHVNLTSQDEQNLSYIQDSEEITESLDQSSLQKDFLEGEQKTIKYSKSDRAEEKHYFSCSFCPYVHPRKFAVQNHMRRHTSTEGSTCPHCNYTSLQASVIRDHLKWHFQPQYVFTAQAFMKYEDIEIWSVDNDENELIFKDSGNGKNSNERFFPSVVEVCSSEGEKEIKHVENENEKVINTVSKDELNEIIPEEEESNSNEKHYIPKDLEKKLKQLAVKQQAKIVLTDVFLREKTTEPDFQVSAAITVRLSSALTKTNDSKCNEIKNEEYQSWNEKIFNEISVKIKDPQVHSDDSNSSDSTVVMNEPLESSEVNMDVSVSDSLTKERHTSTFVLPGIIKNSHPEINSNAVTTKEVNVMQSNYLDQNAPSVCEFSATVTSEDVSNLDNHMYGNDVMMIRFDDDYLRSESGITEVLEASGRTDVDLSLDGTIVKEGIICSEEMNAMFSDDVQVVEVVAENEDSLNDFPAELKTDSSGNSNDPIMASCNPGNNFSTEPATVTEVEIKAA